MTSRQRPEIRVPNRLLGGLRSALLEGITDGSLDSEQSELAKSLMGLIDEASVATTGAQWARSIAEEDGVVLLDETLVLPATSASLTLSRQALAHARSVVLPFEVPIRLRLNEKQLDELEELLADPIA